MGKIECPRFDGTNLKEWLFKVEEFFGVDSTPEHLKGKMAAIHFDGEASTWTYDLILSGVGLEAWIDWKRYVKLLRERFEDDCDDDQPPNGEFGESVEHRMVNLVPEAQEENPKLENLEGWEQMVILEVEGDVENGQEVQSMEKICSAHQMFDKMSLGVQSKRRQIKCHKSWRFKFKDKAQPRELIKGKIGVHEANATRNQLRSPIGFVDDDLHYDYGSDILCVQYLVSSVAVGDFQETQWLFNDELKDIRKFQIVIEEGHHSYAFQECNGISLRSHILHQQKKPSKSPKSWKFKYKIDSEDQLSNSMVKESGMEIPSDRWLSNSICCELETGEIDNDEYRAPSDSDLVVNEVEKVKKDLVAVEVDGETVSLIDNNQHSQEKVKNRSTNSVLQPSLVPQMCSLLKEQVHEAREENSTFEIHKNLVQQVLLEEDSTTNFHEPVSKSENLRKMKVNSLLNNIEAVVAVVERSRQVTVTKYFWSRSENWKKHKTMQLQVILNMLFVKILSIVKLLFQNSLVHHQQTVNADDEKHIMVCVDKSDGQLFWMVFVRKPAIRAVQRIWEKETHDVDIIDANSVLQEEFEQVVNHTPFSVIKLEGLLLLDDESFQIKHKWRFKLLPLILECELYSDRLVLVTNYAQQFDISGRMILMTMGTLFTNLRSQLLFKALKWSIQ